MSAPLLPGLALLVTVATSPRVEVRSLAGFAAQSPRPAVCRPADSASTSALWSAARGGTARPYCSLLARATTRLDAAPEQALELARRAAALDVKDPAARVLEGRALLRLGDLRAARDRLESVLLAPGAPPDVHALRELGVTAIHLGRSDTAIAVYRRVLPRADFANDRYFRRTAALEAASVLAATGPDGAAEAEVYLAEARRKSEVPGLEDLTSAFLALCLDRVGRRDQARVVLNDLANPWGLERFASARDMERLARVVLPEQGLEASEQEVRAVMRRPDLSLPALWDGELHAALAVATRPVDGKLARAHLRVYLDGPGRGGPWESWARNLLRELER
ncbi:MAG TPA: tetratricopeptide repeat protein [Polyangiaceae bacterium]|nr:tetratricopeptide repeat protein [Polyangiaceae bacterium]